jgi:hypothetical protein
MQLSNIEKPDYGNNVSEGLISAKATVDSTGNMESKFASLIYPNTLTYLQMTLRFAEY